MNIFAGLVGLGLVAGQVVGAALTSAYLCYLLPIYILRDQGSRGFRETRLKNGFGLSAKLGALLLAWSGLSLFWAPSPIIAAAYFLSYLVPVIIAYMLCNLYPIREVFRSACKGAATAAAASTPLALGLVGFGGGRLGGEDHNSLVAGIALSECLGILCVCFLLLDKSITRFRATFFLVSLVGGLFLSFAKTELIAFVLATAVYVLLAPGSLGRRLARIGLMGIGLTLALLAASSRIADYQRQTASTDTLTGRTILWAETYAQIANGPLVRGFGLLAFREIGPVPWHGLDRIVHAHNDFLTVLFNFGIIGVVLLFTSYFALGFNAVRAMRSGGGYPATLILCACVFYLIAGVAAGNFIMCVFPLTWLILYDCMLTTYRSGIADRAALAKTRPTWA